MDARSRITKSSSSIGIGKLSKVDHEKEMKRRNKLIIHMNTSKVMPTFEVDVGFQMVSPDEMTSIEMTPM